MNIRNIGILAHVDAGKTTITERMLLISGSIRKAGRVDDGTAHTDTMSVERQRGISVKAQTAAIDWKNTRINLIDTPGHVDFSAEVESALLAMDGAVLVLSAVEGVQAQTVALFRMLEYMGLPMVMFINKTDRAGASVERVMKQIAELTGKAVLYGDTGAQAMTDILSKNDDIFLEAALSDNLTDEIIADALRRTCGECGIYTVFTGAALRGEGVEALLDGIVNCLPEPKPRSGCAVIHKVSHAKNEGRRVHIRVYDGEIGTKTPLYGKGREPEFASRVLLLTPEGYKVVPKLEAGQIGMLLGVKKAGVGEILYSSAEARESNGYNEAGANRFAHPALRVTVTPENPGDIAELTDALAILGDEDPALNINYDHKTRETQLSIMGEIHQEVLEAVLLEEHKVRAVFSSPTVVYRETPSKVGRAELSMFYSPWYAEVTLEIRPTAPGSGARFVSELSSDYIYTKYQREIEQGIMASLEQGIYGWEITDCDIALVGGKCISVVEPSSCFAPLMPMVVMEALLDSGSTLLEPMYSFEILIDEDCAGTVLYDLTVMRGVFDTPVTGGGMVRISGTVPVATSLHYQKRLTGLSRGRGIFGTRFFGYSPVSPELGSVAARNGVDPLDRRLFLLSLKGVL